MNDATTRNAGTAGLRINGDRLWQSLMDLAAIGATRVNPSGGGADIGPLRKLDVPTMSLNQDARWYFDYHHTPADTPDKVDPHELALNVAALSVMSFALAEMEPRLAPFPPPAEEHTR